MTFCLIAVGLNMHLFGVKDHISKRGFLDLEVMFLLFTLIHRIALNTIFVEAYYFSECDIIYLPNICHNLGFLPKNMC